MRTLNGEYTMKGYASYYQFLETNWSVVIEDMIMRPKLVKKTSTSRMNTARKLPQQELRADSLLLRACKLDETHH